MSATGSGQNCRETGAGGGDMWVSGLVIHNGPEPVHRSRTPSPHYPWSKGKRQSSAGRHGRPHD